MKGTFDPLVESIGIIEEDMESLITWQNDTETVISELQVLTSVAYFPYTAILQKLTHFVNFRVPKMCRFLDTQCIVN